MSNYTKRLNEYEVEIGWKQNAEGAIIFIMLEAMTTLLLMYGRES